MFYLFLHIKNYLPGRTGSNLFIIYSLYVITRNLICGLLISCGFYAQLPWVGVQWKKVCFNRTF